MVCWVRFFASKLFIEKRKSFVVMRSDLLVVISRFLLAYLKCIDLVLVIQKFILSFIMEFYSQKLMMLLRLEYFLIAFHFAQYFISFLYDRLQGQACLGKNRILSHL
jgi:hypothetical protein